MLVRSASKVSSQKFATAVYFSARGNDWVKKTCARRETLAIAGFALKQNKFDGIYAGRRKGKDLVYAGKVDHGFDKSSTAELQARSSTATDKSLRSRVPRMFQVRVERVGKLHAVGETALQPGLDGPEQPEAQLVVICRERDHETHPSLA